MPIITVEQIKATNLGYLTGADLIKWCAPAHLIKQLNVDADCLIAGTDTAYKEVRNKLATRYDITDELKNTGIINAAASALMAGGIITGTPLTNPGIGYISVPTVIITDAVGTGATAVATLSGNLLNNIAVTNGGSGYTNPSVVITGGLGPDKRETVLVKITAIWAIRNILGNYEHISKEMESNFAWADQEVWNIRNAQSNLEIDEASRCIASTARLVSSRFRTIG